MPKPYTRSRAKSDVDVVLTRAEFIAIVMEHRAMVAEATKQMAFNPLAVLAKEHAQGRLDYLATVAHLPDTERHDVEARAITARLLLAALAKARDHMDADADEHEDV